MHIRNKRILIGVCVALGTLANVTIILFAYRFEEYSRAVFVIYASLLLLMLIGSRASFRLMGSGLGLRLSAGKSYQISADWAHAMMDGPRTPKGENRVHVRLGASF